MKNWKKLLEGKGRYWLIGLGFLVGVWLLLAGNGGGETAAKAGEEPFSEQEYCRALEERLSALCSSVEGAGEVRIMIRVEGGYVSVYEKDAEGDPVTVGGGSSESAVLSEVTLPRIAGVGIVCHGAKNERVKQELLALVSATLGIGTHKIYIAT